MSDGSELKPEAHPILQGPTREEVARIIDPDIWATRDYLAALQQPMMEHVNRCCEPSLAKASAILALLNPTSPWRPVLGEPIRMAKDWYSAEDWRQDWLNQELFYAGTVQGLAGPDTYVATRWPIQHMGDLTDGFSMDDIEPLPALPGGGE